jgi:hypothetical protein
VLSWDSHLCWQCSAASPNLPSSGLLADASVNMLAQEIGMAVVAGVLLDHVNQELLE